MTAKGYSSPSEEARRKQIWLDNREVVLVHNILADQGIKSYRLGMTEFADMVCARKTELWLTSAASPSPFVSLFPFVLKSLVLHPFLSPGQRRVQAPDFSGLPGPLRRHSAPQGLHFLQTARGQGPAHRRRLEAEGIRHRCQGPEGVWLLLGLQRRTSISNSASFPRALKQNLFWF